MKIRTTMICGAILSLSLVNASAQQSGQSTEQRVPLTEAAVALDANGAPTLEGTLRTTALNGAPDTPVTNIRVVIKNVSSIYYNYVSGLVTFYDQSGVRCGEGLFKADALAPGESVETDTPGIRIRCAPAGWRVVATNLVIRNPLAITTTPTEASGRLSNLVISIDGEEHPIQLEKPMTLNLGNKQRTIVVRRMP